MPKVLIFGFSVTADKQGYVPKLKEVRADLDIYWCGLGGISCLQAVYVIDRELRRAEFDLVLFEVTTQWRAAKFNAHDYYWPARYLFEAAHRRGARVCAVHLYRKEADVPNDPLTSALDTIAAGLGGSTLDLATSLKTSGLLAQVLIDIVHVRDAGAQWYADQISPFIDECLALPRSEAEYQFGGSEFIWFPLSDEADNEQFERSGFKADFLSLADGARVARALPEPLYVNGISYLMGPDTGRVTVTFDNASERSLVCYDAYCYYTRAQMQLITPQRTSAVALMGHGDIPEIPLKKGATFQGSRSAKVLGLLCTREPVDTIAARACVEAL